MLLGQTCLAIPGDCLGGRADRLTPGCTGKMGYRDWHPKYNHLAPIRSSNICERLSNPRSPKPFWTSPGRWPQSRDISKPNEGAPGPSRWGPGMPHTSTRNPLAMLPFSPPMSAWRTFSWISLVLRANGRQLCGCSFSNIPGCRNPVAGGTARGHLPGRPGSWGRKAVFAIFQAKPPEG